MQVQRPCCLNTSSHQFDRLFLHITIWCIHHTSCNLRTSVCLNYGDPQKMDFGAPSCFLETKPPPKNPLPPFPTPNQKTHTPFGCPLTAYPPKGPRATSLARSNRSIAWSRLCSTRSAQGVQKAWCLDGHGQPTAGPGRAPSGCTHVRFRKIDGFPWSIEPPGPGIAKPV